MALREVPERTGPGGVGRVLAAGVCGTDVALFAGTALSRRIGDLVLGHENVIRIDGVDDATAARWSVTAGQRVLVEEYVPCGHCSRCRSGAYRVCPRTDFNRPRFTRYGRMPIADPGPWGGFGERLYVHPDAWLHPVPESLLDHHATLAVPLANAHRWLTRVATVGPGDAVAVIGPGIVGLAAVAVASAAGASLIALAGIASDARRLDAGAALGAHPALAEPDALVTEVSEATGGAMADIVLDATGGAPGALELAARLAGHGATIVLSGAPAGRPEALAAAVARHELVVRGARGHDGAAIDAALELLAAGRVGLADVVADPVDLPGAPDTLAWLGSPDVDRPIHVSIVPR